MSDIKVIKKLHVNIWTSYLFEVTYKNTNLLHCFRLLFWSDWGRNPKIETANMDGTGRRLLLNMTGISWPNGMIIDYKGRLSLKSRVLFPYVV